jgi:TolB protein
MRIVVVTLVIAVAAVAFAADKSPAPAKELALPDEKHLKNVKQLTNGGENAEAYFDQTGKELIFQSKRDGAQCDAIYRMTADGQNVRQVSVGGGRTTCSYIRPDGKIIYASTHGHQPGCLDEPDRSQGYVWKVYSEFDIWIADGDGKNAKLLFQSPGYDAEATICHSDGRIIFTSSKSGDLELYVMDKDGKNVTQLTNTPGYDGGAFFSEDCSKIVWRASRPEGDALADYQALLKRDLVRPTKLEIFVADIDKKNVVTNVKQVTNNGKANFAPYLHPDNKRVLYVSNKGDPKGRDFDIYMVNIDGSNEARITTNPTFDGFPMFTPDGKRLVFASNRNNAKEGETNVFIADWVD